MAAAQARWGWWLVVVLGACSKPPEAPDAGPVLDAARFCTEYRLAFAESFVRCGLYSPGWGEERRAEASLPCQFDSQLRFDPEKARGCLTALAASCDDVTACADTAVGTIRAATLADNKKTEARFIAVSPNCRAVSAV